MNLRYFIAFLKDMFRVLPTYAEEEWQEVSDLDVKRPTVVLVSGFGATRRNLSALRKRLRRDGNNVLIVALDWNLLEDNVRGLRRLSEQLSSLILRIKKKPGMGRNKIYLVAHSAGGLVARHYVQLLGGSHYCEGLITLATPHSGTWVAGLGFFTHMILKGRCLYQMLPISGFLKTLNSHPFPDAFPMVSIFSQEDYLCPPRSTRLSKLHIRASQVKHISVPGLSHSQFLQSKRCYRLIQKMLESDFAENGDAPSLQEQTRV